MVAPQTLSAMYRRVILGRPKNFQRQTRMIQRIVRWVSILKSGSRHSSSLNPLNNNDRIILVQRSTNAWLNSEEKNAQQSASLNELSAPDTASKDTASLGSEDGDISANFFGTGLEAEIGTMGLNTISEPDPGEGSGATDSQDNSPKNWLSPGNSQASATSGGVFSPPLDLGGDVPTQIAQTPSQPTFAVPFMDYLTTDANTDFNVWEFLISGVDVSGDGRTMRWIEKLVLPE